MTFKIKKLQVEILENWSWNNRNTCFLELWIQKINFLNLENCGLTILPLHFWEEIACKYRKDWRRFHFGCGLFSFFISFKR